MGSNENFRHLSDGINLVPNATTEVENPGDIDYSTSNGQFNFFTASGVEQIIGTISPQTLTNKTINLANNTIIGNLGFAAQFDPSTGHLESSLTTSTELGYVHGVTSPIQTQLNTLSSEISSISSSYVSSLNSLTGAVTLTAGSNVTITPSGNSLIIASTGGGGGSGTVTSVGLVDGSTAPIYSITNSPITVSGNLTFSLINQSANTIFAGPSSGSAAQPSFRSLVAADLNTIVIPIANGGTNNGSLPVTAGGVLYTDGTRVQNVGAGTSGYVLQSNGSSSPSWVPQGGGGGSVPTGTILSFAGPIANIPSGFLLCDGTSQLISAYPALAAVLFDSGTGNYAWGSVDGLHFNLPGSLGVFLRGQNDGSGNDPDAASRAAILPGGNSGDHVGSYQLSAVQNHTHLEEVTASSGAFTGVQAVSGAGATTTPSNVETGGVTSGNVSTGETRPINVYVVYMIKT